MKTFTLKKELSVMSQKILGKIYVNHMQVIHSQEKVLARSRFFEANFDGFWQFSQKVFKIQKFYIPCWKALVFSFQKLYQHRVWLPPKNRYAPLNESRTVSTQKGVADK